MTDHEMRFEHSSFTISSWSWSNLHVKDAGQWKPMPRLGFGGAGATSRVVSKLLICSTVLHQQKTQSLKAATLITSKQSIMDDDDIQFDPDLPISHADNNKSRDPANSNPNHNPEDALSPLEREVLDEYARLVGNLDDVWASETQESAC